jgi:hypothetical protein
MGLHELLVELVDELLELVVGELGVQEQRGVHLESPVMDVDPPDAARSAVDGEDLARLGADDALEARCFHGPTVSRGGLTGPTRARRQAARLRRRAPRPGRGLNHPFGWMPRLDFRT